MLKEYEVIIWNKIYVPESLQSSLLLNANYETKEVDEFSKRQILNNKEHKRGEKVIRSVPK